MKKFITFIALLMAVAYLQSCEQHTIDPSASLPNSLQRDLSALQNIDQFTETENDAIKIILAKSLAKTVTNPAIRDFLKAEVMKEFDGDFDILFNTIKHQKIGELTFAQHLIINLPVLEDINKDAARKQERYDFEAVKTFVKNLDIDTDKMPLLQIAVPHYGEDWDPTIPSIPVMAVTDGLIQNYNQSLEIKAYSEDGSTVKLKSNELPKFPVMVVSENERLTIVSKNKEKADNAKTALAPACPQALYYEDENFEYYYGDIYLNCGGGGTPPTVTPPPTNSGCKRDRKSSSAYEKMRNIEFLSMDKLRQAEGWFSGRIELRAIVMDYKTAQAGDDAFTMLFYEKCSEYKTCGIFNCRTDNYDPNRDIFVWNKNNIGDRIKVRFYEDNKGSGNEYTIKIPLKVKVKILGQEVEVGVEIGAKIKPKNVNLGDNYVYYCDDTNRYYDNGWLHFQIRPEGM